jgi:hypothetical protein
LQLFGGDSASLEELRVWDLSPPLEPAAARGEFLPRLCDESLPQTCAELATIPNFIHNQSISDFAMSKLADVSRLAKRFGKALDWCRDGDRTHLEKSFRAIMSHRCLTLSDQRSFFQNWCSLSPECGTELKENPARAQ